MKQRKIKSFNVDLISMITTIVMMIALGIAIGIYIENTSLIECEDNPFVYGSQMMEKKYDAKFFGTGQFMTLGTPMIYFDSTNMTIEPYKN